MKTKTYFSVLAVLITGALGLSLYSGGTSSLIGAQILSGTDVYQYPSYLEQVTRIQRVGEKAAMDARNVTSDDAKKVYKKYPEALSLLLNSYWRDWQTELPVWVDLSDPNNVKNNMTDTANFRRVMTSIFDSDQRALDRSGVKALSTSTKPSDRRWLKGDETIKMITRAFYYADQEAFGHLYGPNSSTTDLVEFLVDNEYTKLSASALNRDSIRLIDTAEIISSLLDYAYGFHQGKVGAELTHFPSELDTDTIEGETLKYLLQLFELERSGSIGTISPGVLQRVSDSIGQRMSLTASNVKEVRSIFYQVIGQTKSEAHKIESIGFPDANGKALRYFALRGYQEVGDRDAEISWRMQGPNTKMTMKLQKGAVLLGNILPTYISRRTNGDYPDANMLDWITYPFAPQHSLMITENGIEPLTLIIEPSSDQQTFDGDPVDDHQAGIYIRGINADGTLEVIEDSVHAYSDGKVRLRIEASKAPRAKQVYFDPNYKSTSQ